MITPLDYVVHLELARSSVSRSGQERYARLVTQPASPRPGRLMQVLRAFAARLRRAPALRQPAPAACCSSAAELA